MNSKRLWAGLGLLSIVVIGWELWGSINGLPPLPSDPQFVDASERRHPDQIARDPLLFWRYRPDQSIHGNFPGRGVYTINSHGFRTPEFAYDKPEGTLRVVCFGGSTTFGLGVADSETYPQELEGCLNVQDTLKRHWEVIGLGITNYSSFQGLRLAEQILPELNADIVLINFAWGDLQEAADNVPDSDIPIPAALRVTMTNLLQRSAIVRYASATWHSWFVPDRIIAKKSVNIRRVSIIEFTANIEKICRQAKMNGAQPFVITSPISWPPSGYSDHEGIFEYHHRYRRATRFGANLAQSTFFELAVAFDDHPEFFDTSSGDFANFNAAGHEFAAKFIARKLLEQTFDQPTVP